MKMILLAVFLVGLSPSLAVAHARLVEAVPPAGGTATSVGVIRLTFNEGVEAKFSTIKMSDVAGHPLSLPVAAADPQDMHSLRLVLLEPLAPGEYRVSWSVVSVDTHRTSGSFTFSVRR